MNESGYQTLSRDVEATQIPSGTSVPLKAGTAVMITQALGGTFTIVVPERGGLFRLSAADADALGQTVSAPDATSKEAGTFTEEKIWEQLRNCYDPEIPVNIVDLGLIYSLTISDALEGMKKVDIQMTLTAPGCGMGPALAADAEQRVVGIPGVGDVKVALVWDPPWSPERISAAGRQKLGME